MRPWSFITNHALVLSFVSQDPSITANEMALEIGITERAIRRIISELEDGGYLAKEKQGRRVKYEVQPQAPMKQKALKDMCVADLLKVLGNRSDVKFP